MESGHTWPRDKRAGLSLTFDDARPSQVDRGTPVLDRYGIKATFYALPSMLRYRPQGWKEVVTAGHELGNHTVSHPCSRNFAFSRENVLEDYTLERLEEELVQANEALEAFTGRRPTSFAYPCGQRFVGRGKATRSYVPLVAEHFLVGRGFLDETLNDPLRCDMAQVSGVAADGMDFEQLRMAIDSALEGGGWCSSRTTSPARFGRRRSRRMPLKRCAATCHASRSCGPTRCRR